MIRPEKHDYPVDKALQFLEPGPVMLLTSHYEGKSNIITLGWHSILAFPPSLVGCKIEARTHSFQMVLGSRECVINLPGPDMFDLATEIGNCSGANVDKFDHFGLTAKKADLVSAPMIDECHACFECRIHDDSMVEHYNYFIFEIIKAHVADEPNSPSTFHCTPDGEYVLSDEFLRRK